MTTQQRAVNAVDDAINKLKATMKPVSKITRRKAEIIQFTAQGLTAEEIGVIMGLSKRTVEEHKRVSMELMEVNNSAQMISVGYKTGLLTIN